MGSLSTVEANLPPGFRFHPKDEELICDYLIQWVSAGGSCSHQNISPPSLLIQVDLNKCEPWDIPETACVGGKEWYFYSQRDKKYSTGIRTNRATISGYWKATGKDRPILRKDTLVGMRKTLVFYQGRAPKGTKTEWVMHEFRLEGPGPKLASSPKDDWVLCKVFYKNKSSTEIGCDDTNSLTNIEPYDNRQVNRSNAAVSPDYNQQVPCFSVFAPSPYNNYVKNNFSSSLPAAIVDPGPGITIPNNVHNGSGGMWAPQFQNIHPSSNNDDSNFDSHHLKSAVSMSRVIKMESGANDQSNKRGTMINGFGEGSSNSYMSEVGLSNNYMWNVQGF